MPGKGLGTGGGFGATTPTPQPSAGGWIPKGLAAAEGKTIKGHDPTYSALGRVYSRLSGDSSGQQHTELNAYLTGLQHAGLSADDAQKYLYQYLQQRQADKNQLVQSQGEINQQRQAGNYSADPNSPDYVPGGTKKGPLNASGMAQQIVGGAYAETIPGQMQSPQYQAQASEAHIAGQAYTDLMDQLNLADMYDVYTAHKGQKGWSSPLTLYNETMAKLGVQAGDISSGDSIRQAAWNNYYNATGSWGVGQGGALSPASLEGQGGTLYGGEAMPTSPTDAQGNPIAQISAVPNYFATSPATPWSTLLTQALRRNATQNAFTQMGIGNQFDPATFLRALQEKRLPGTKAKAPTGGTGLNQSSTQQTLDQIQQALLGGNQNASYLLPTG